MQMRCESADPTVSTEVIFDFGLGSRFFRARREPEQMKAAKRGNASALVSHPAAVTLWEIDESGAELAVLGSGVRAVREKVEDLVGFSSEQFRQVVVLPQGKFRDLLTAGSDDRAKILSQLFRTDQYAAMERALLERAKVVTKKREELTIQRSTILSTVDVSTDEVLEALTLEATALVAASKKAEKAAEKTARSATTAFEVAKSQVQALWDLKAAQEALVQLEAQIPQIAALKVRVGTCQKSLKVQPLLHAATAAADELTEAAQSLARAETQLKAAKLAEASAVLALATLGKRGPEREQAQELVRKLTAMQAKLVEWQQSESQRASAQSELVAAETLMQAAKDGVMAARQAQEKLKTGGDEAKDAANQLEKLLVLRDQDLQALERLQRLAAARSALALAQQTFESSQTAVEVAAGEFAFAQTDHTRVEKAWRAGRAAALAQSLAEGEPCPVCGSKKHPNPATAAHEADDVALDSARTALDQARVKLEEATAAAAVSDSVKASAGIQVITLEQEAGVATTVDEIQARVATREATIARHQATVTAAGDPVESAARAEETSVSAEAARSHAEAVEKAANAKLTSASTAATMLEKSLPEELRSETALTMALKSATTTRDALETALLQAQTAGQSAKEARIAAARDTKAASDATTKARKKSESADKAMSTALSTHGFEDPTACEGALMSDADLEAAESTIATHHDSLTATRAAVAQAQKAAVSTAEQLDIDTLEVQAIAANDAHTGAVQAHTQAADRLASLSAVRTRLDQVDADHKKVDDEYAVVGVLAAVANGQGQGAKISFQRWVLGAYLDDVLIASTKRLLTMSKGRYQLERQRQVTDRKRASGLDLAVFDTWSNRARPALTLSGGESFLAALSLALGLAQTVQEQAGGTRLDTVFVDEGFGSLDQEALDLAMEALIELKDTGRLVGVISHVPELRDAIDARLEVSAGPAGSQAKFIVG